MEVEPKSLVFRDVRLQHAYTTSCCITNQQSSVLSAELISNSSRYSITPNRINLTPGSSIVVTVRLFLNHYPSFNRDSEGYDDVIKIKSSYFEQTVGITFFLHSRDSITRARSLSPAPSTRGNDTGTNSNRSRTTELEKEISHQAKTIRLQQSQISLLESNHPQLMELVNIKVEQEIVQFEGKSEKVLRILEKKDQTIKQLQNDIEQMKSRQSVTVTSAMSSQDHPSYLQQKLDAEMRSHTNTKAQLKLALDAAKSSTSSSPDSKEFADLRERAVDQAEQIQVLIAELSKVRGSSSAAGSFSSTAAVGIADKQHMHQSGGIAQNNSSEQEIRRLRGEIKRLNERYGDLERSYLGLEESISGRVDTTARAAAATAHVETSRMSEEIKHLQAMLAQSRSLEAVSKRQHLEAETKIAAIEKEKTELVERAEKLRAERNETLLQLDRMTLDLSEARSQRGTQETDEGLKEAHMWWSYIWHELRRQSATNALGIQPQGDQRGVFGASASNGGIAASGHGHSVGSFASVPLFEGQGEAMVVANKLRESLREQAVETAMLRQELLGRKLTAKREVEFLKSRLEHTERELVKVSGAARAHKDDKEIQIAEMASTIRVLSGRGEMHAQTAAARQDLQSERLAVHHLRADVDAYRNMLEVEQEKVANLRKELTMAQGAVEAFAVFSTLTDLPSVSAVTLMELMSGRIMLQQQQLVVAKAHAERSQAETRKLRRIIDAKISSSSSSARRSESPSGGRPSSSSGLEGAEDIETLKKRYSGILRANNLGNGKDGLQRGSRSRDESEDEGSDNDVNDDMEEIPDEGFFGDAATTGVNAWRPVDGLSKGISSFPCTSRNAAQDRAADTSAMSALSLVVDGETTPQVLLDSLNAATMAQKLISQDSIIATLRAQLSDVQDSLVRAESVHTKEIDELEGKSRIEIDIAHRRLELLQANINEAKAEIILLKEKNAELDAEVLNGQTRFFEAYPGDAHRGRGAGVHEPSSMSTAFEIAMLNAGADAGDMDTSSVQMSVNGHRHANGASDAMNHHHRGSFTEADSAELDRVKSLLKERTSQLRIVMDTLDAVQAEGTKPGFARAAGTRDYLSQSYGVGDVEGAEALFGLTGISGGPGGTGYSAQSASIEGPWGVTSLVKRVVELTADLTSQNAAMAMEERRALQLEKESQRKTRDIGQLQTLIKGHEEALAKMKLNLEALGSQLRDTDKRRHDEVGAMRVDNERLASALRDAENEVAAHQVTIEELSRQIDLSEQVDQRQWLESVILKDAEICAKHVDAREQQKSSQRRVDDGGGFGSKQERVDLRSLMPLLAPVKENLSNEAAAGGHLSVRDLVISLLAQWRDQVGPMSFVKASSHTHKESGKHSSLTKAEQRFYQRVCDLVTGANHRCSQAVDESRWADCEKMKAELSLKVAQDRLRATVQQLQRYRKRAYACEKVARGDRKHIEKKETKLVSLMTRSVNEQRSKLTSLTNSLFAERKERQVTDISRVAERLELRRLQVKVAELEARGGPSLRGRDEALSGLDERIKTTEASMHAWFKVELPRLMGGLPLQEESMANYFDSVDQRSAASGYGLASSSGFPEGKDAAGNNGRSFFGSSSSFPISSHLGAVMGMDRSYALAQTLCACKAGQAVRDMQITGLKEKNYILKERNVELEMVLKRWRKDIDDTAVQLASLLPLSSASVNGGSGKTNLRGPDGSMDKAERLAIQVEEWQRRSQDLEGMSIEMKAKLDRANSRLEEMAQLVDVLTSEGDNLKGESTRQLTRTRVDLENAHASELRSIRVTCEEEKRSLMEQLDALASIVEVARLSSVADAMSRGGKAGSYTKLVNSMKKMLDSREHGRRKQRDQVSFGNDNSDGLDVDSDNSDNDRRLGKQRDTFGGFQADRRHDVGAGSDMNSSSHRQTQTAFIQQDPQLVRGLEEKLAKLTSELEVERTRCSAARSEARELEQLLTVQRLAVGMKQQGDVNEERGRDAASIASSDEMDSMSDIGRNLPLTTRLKARSSKAVVQMPVSPPHSTVGGGRGPLSPIPICAACTHAKDKASAAWDVERGKLMNQVQDLEQQVTDLRSAQESTTQALRARYQTMLDQAQEALVMQSGAASEQIDRLGGLLQQSQSQLQMERLAQRNQQQTAPPPPPAEDRRALDEELKEMRHAVERASDQLVDAKERLDAADSSHRNELMRLRDEAEQYRNDHDEAFRVSEMRVADLEQQLRSAQVLVQQMQQQAKQTPDQQAALSPLSAQRLRNVRLSSDHDRDDYVAADDNAARREINTQGVNLSDAAMRGLLEKLNAVTGEEVVDDVPGVASTGSLLHSDARSSALRVTVADEADFEVRMGIAEREMRELQESLVAERRMNESLRSQLHEAVERDQDAESADVLSGVESFDDDQKQEDDHGASHSLLARSASFPGPQLPVGTSLTSPRHATSSPDSVDAVAAGGSSYANFMRESAAELLVPDEGSGNELVPREKVKALVRRMNDMRKRARVELARLRRVYSQALSRERDREDEQRTLRTQAAEAREQLQSLKEDVSRKAKLLVTLKEAKISDNATLDQWRSEAKEHEETIKRLQRSLVSKDALVRDLKSRLETVEELSRSREAALKDHAKVVAERSRDSWRDVAIDNDLSREADTRNKQRESSFKPSGVASGSGSGSGSAADSNRPRSRSGTPGRSSPPGGAAGAGGGGGSIHALFSSTFAEADRRFDRAALEEELVSSTAHLSASELRNRLRTAEVDRGRCKQRLSALKDKVLDLEVHLKEVQKDRDQALAIADKYEDLKAAVARKEAMVKSYKAEVQRLRDDNGKLVAEHDETVIEAEKKLRHMQRQLEMAERYRSESEKELMTLRERLLELEGRNAAFVRAASRPPSTAAMPSSSSSSVPSSSSSSSSATTQQQQQQQQQQRSSARQQQTAPSTTTSTGPSMSVPYASSSRRGAGQQPSYGAGMSRQTANAVASTTATAAGARSKQATFAAATAPGEGTSGYGLMGGADDDLSVRKYSSVDNFQASSSSFISFSPDTMIGDGGGSDPQLTSSSTSAQAAIVPAQLGMRRSFEAIRMPLPATGVDDAEVSSRDATSADARDSSSRLYLPAPPMPASMSTDNQPGLTSGSGVPSSSSSSYPTAASTMAAMTAPMPSSIATAAVPSSLESSIADLTDIMSALGAARSSL